MYPDTDMHCVHVFRTLQESLLIIGLRMVHFFEISLPRMMVSHDCFTFVHNLQLVFHLCLCIENTRCLNSRCPLLGLWIQPLPASAWTRPTSSGQLPQRPARPGAPEPSPDRGSGQ